METKLFVETSNGLVQKTQSEMLEEIKAKGVTIEQAGDYWKAVRYNEDGQYDVVWQDSACDEAYDYESAVLFVYSMLF